MTATMKFEAAARNCVLFADTFGYELQPEELVKVRATAHRTPSALRPTL